MTTAVHRIAWATAGQGSGTVPSSPSRKLSAVVVKSIHWLCASCFRSDAIRRARFTIHEIKENDNGLSGTFGICDQDGGRRRIQDLHVHPRYGDPRLHGGRDPRTGRRVRRHGHGPDRLSDHRRDPVSGRLLHAVSAGLRPADRRLRADAAGADRQASGRDDRRRPAQLGPGLHRQFRRRLYRRPDDGDRLHLRLLDRRPTRSAK